MLIITVLQETMVCHTPKFTYYSVKDKTEIWLHQTPESSNQCAHIKLCQKFNVSKTKYANLEATNKIEAHTTNILIRKETQ